MRRANVSVVFMRHGVVAFKCPTILERFSNKDLKLVFVFVLDVWVTTRGGSVTPYKRYTKGQFGL